MTGDELLDAPRRDAWLGAAADALLASRGLAARLVASGVSGADLAAIEARIDRALLDIAALSEKPPRPGG